MKISLNWLKNYIDINVPLDTFVEKLTLAGIEVEEVIPIGGDLPGVVIGHVLEKEKHPDADKLTVCNVDVGGENPVTIVCGAPNVAAGMTVPVATVGAVLPGDFKIKKAKLRGIVSKGMICSEKELGLGEDQSGIWDLGTMDARPGTPINDALEIENDSILDLSITPNRPDCLSALGIARELGAILGVSVKKPVVEIFESANRVENLAKVRIEAPHGNPRYSARIIENVKIGSSPEWLKKVLKAAGMRPINNVVDVTNYVMLELGQPLHAFDHKLLAGSEIVVRESRTGEKFTTLDEKDHELPARTVLICDGDKPVALGGIMGGMNSEISDDTTTILLESAYFAPEAIRSHAKVLSISSESSQRFERGTDPNGVLFAQDRAAGLIAELTGGEVASGVIDVYPQIIEEKHIALRPEKIKQVLGLDMNPGKIRELLLPLGVVYEEGIAIAPTFRPDLEREIDLVEEVARRYGLDNIEGNEKVEILYHFPVNKTDLFMDRLRSFLSARRLYEVVTNTMVSAKDHIDDRIQPVSLLNPLSDDMDTMRTSMVPSLLRVFTHNQNRQLSDIQIFEIGKVFVKDDKSDTGSNEWWELGILLSGKLFTEQWGLPEKSVDIYYAKGIASDIFRYLSGESPQFQQSENRGFDQLQLTVKIGNRTLGMIGKIEQKTAKKYSANQDVYFINLSLEALQQIENPLPQYKPISRFPFVRKDLAFALKKSVRAEDISDYIKDLKIDHLITVDLFDLYEGKQISDDEKSIAFKLIFQSDKRTLTEVEVNESFESIIASVKKKFNARLRDR